MAFDFHKTIINTSSDYLRKISAYNPFAFRKAEKNYKPYLAFAAVSFFWGTTWVASKIGVQYMPGLQLAGIRQIIAGIIFVLFFLFRGTPLPKPNEWKTILILSLLNFTLSNGLSTWGVHYVPAGLASIIGSIFPFWIVIIGLFSVSNSKIPRKAIVGLLLGFSGICIIFYEHLVELFNPSFLFGIILCLISTWTWALATIYTKQKAQVFNPYFSLGWQMLISGIVLVIFTTANKTAVSITHLHWQAWASIFYLIIFGSIIGFLSYLYALQNLPTNFMSSYAYINPIVAVIFGAILFGEKFTILIFIGGFVALYGVAMINRAFKAVPPIEQPEPEGM